MPKKVLFCTTLYKFNYNNLKICCERRVVEKEGH